MGHWYSVADGSPQHFQTKADGSSRDTTLRDARKQALVPSVTTIINTAASPALHAWLINQHVGAAHAHACSDWTTGKEPEIYDEWSKAVKKMANEYALAARDEGDAIHKAMEDYFTTGKIRGQFAAKVSATLDRMQADGLSTLPQDWVAEYTFAKRVGNYGYGGAVDLHDPAGRILIDFKTKDLGGKTVKQLAWPDQARQLAAYANAIWSTAAGVRCINIYIGRDVDVALSHEWKAAELGTHWRCFQNLLENWYLERDFYPYAEVAA